MKKEEFLIPYSTEKTYLDLVRHVIENGMLSDDRTGTGTRSIFGASLRFDLSKGNIPIITTKKINPSAPKLEMDWMMSGNTNIKWLQERGIRIWDGWTKKGSISELSPINLVENKTPTEDLAELATTMMVTHVDTSHTVGVNGDFPDGVSELTQTLYSRYVEHTMYSINKYVYDVADEDNKYKPIALLKTIGCLGLSRELQDFTTFCKVFNNINFISPFHSSDSFYATSTYHGEKIITPENIKFATDKVILMWHMVDTEGYWKEDIEHFFPNGKSWVYHFANPNSNAAKLIKPEAGAKLLRHMETIGDVGPIYGESWRSFRSSGHNWEHDGEQVDQLRDLIDELIENKRSRRHILLAWNPLRLKEMGLPPCHVLCQFYVSSTTDEEKVAYSNYAYAVSTKKPPEWKLSLSVYFRSNDLGLGTPYNIINYSSMLINLATRVNMIPGDLLITIGDAHVYENHIDGLTEQLSREPFEQPTYRIVAHDKEGNNGVGETLFDVYDYNHHPFIFLPVAI